MSSVAPTVNRGRRVRRAVLMVMFGLCIAWFVIQPSLEPVVVALGTWVMLNDQGC